MAEASDRDILPVDGGGDVLGMRHDEMKVEHVQEYPLLTGAAARPM